MHNRLVTILALANDNGVKGILHRFSY